MEEKTKLETFLRSSSYTSPSYVKKLKFIFSAICDYALSKGRAIQDIKILECGCGTGGITFPLASLGCSVTAFDIDSSVVLAVSERVQKDRLDRVTVVKADGRSFDDGRVYDIVIASEVLEHVDNPEVFVERIKARLNRGGWLVVTIPNGYGPWELRRKLSVLTLLHRNVWVRRVFGKGAWLGHCQFYTRKRFIEMLSAFSFRLKNFGKSDSILAIFTTRWGCPLSRLDVWLADILPWWLASGWYFVFEAE
jgi:2-polyprenyl-3-methyl-5-hydroxy-6-metoxy-1,4-benzoquinol methylase